MNLATTLPKPISNNKLWFVSLYLVRACIAGTLMPLGFAPFHFPGLAILGIAIFFAELQNKTLNQALKIGLVFGASYMGLGVSWVFVSIHMYGHLNILLSSLITITFIAYLSVFYAALAGIYNYINHNLPKLLSCLLFSALWCVFEFIRSNVASGFPWLLIGFSQIDTPLQHLLPIIGVYGVGFLTCFTGSLLYFASRGKYSFARLTYIIMFIAILITPLTLKSFTTSKLSQKAIPVGVVQANISMRDKWDEDIFTQMTNKYEKGIQSLLKQTKFIVLPESAIPVPKEYIGEYIAKLNTLANKHKSTFLIGIPKASQHNENLYYNSLSSFGIESGEYFKRHLVPFGEYIPKPFQTFTNFLNIPDAGMIQGSIEQNLLTFKKHAFASLICFEVAYPELIRNQMPNAAWIVSVSDDGWFGHSLAIYQQLQMSQVISALTSRYQVVANNNGLSSIIDNKGKIINSLPSFSSMNLYGNIHPAQGITIWAKFGDMPYLYLCIVIIIIALLIQRRYSSRSTLSC